MGLSNVHGVVAGTPRGTLKGTPRANTDPNRRHSNLDSRQAQKPPIRFPGVGLGPGVAGFGAPRHGTSGSVAGNYETFSAPSVSSRGM